MLRRTALALLALVALVTAACGDSTSAAIRVGDAELSEQDFLDELDEWSGNETALQQLMGVSAQGDAPGGYSSELVTQVATVDIQLMLHEQELARQGIELTSEDIDGAAPILFGDDEQAAEDVLGGFSDDYRQKVLRVVASQVAVEEALGEDGYTEWVRGAIADADVEISSRFGSWDPASASVQPPEGPHTPAAA